MNKIAHIFIVPYSDPAASDPLLLYVTEKTAPVFPLIVWCSTPPLLISYILSYRQRILMRSVIHRYCMYLNRQQVVLCASVVAFRYYSYPIFLSYHQRILMRGVIHHYCIQLNRYCGHVRASVTALHHYSYPIF